MKLHIKYKKRYELLKRLYGENTDFHFQQWLLFNTPEGKEIGDNYARYLRSLGEINMDKQTIKKLNDLTGAVQDQAIEIHNAMAGIIEELEKYKVELERMLRALE